MRYYTATRLSEHIHETPEGYLLCVGVPIARTGVMEYAAGEVPVAASDGRVLVERHEEDVFAPEAIASFEGKPFVVIHPEEDVTPATWAQVARGHAQNVRRGEGAESDRLLADLLIAEAGAIASVRGGLREISCGYDADYEEIAPGRGRQRNIRGNHIALVPAGRCGPRCKINDNREDAMKPKKKFVDRLLELFSSPAMRKTLDAMDEEPAPEPEKKPDPAQDEDPDRLTALEAKLEELTVIVRQLASKAQDEEGQAGDEEPTAPPAQDEGEEGKEQEGEAGKAADAARKARDARTVDADTKTRAAVLYPGIQVADTDRRCAVQRVALRAAAKDKAVDGLVRSMLGGSTLDSCDCLTLDAAFLAASELAKANNNRRTADGLTKAKARDFGKAVSPAEINKANREFYAKGGK